MNDFAAQVPAIPHPVDLATSASPAGAAKAEAVAPRLRLWPALILLALQWIALTVPKWLAPTSVFHMYGMMIGCYLGPLTILVWWLLASRIRWRDRFLGLAAFLVVGAVCFPFLHPSIGAMGVVFLVVPMVCTTVVLAFLATPFLPWPMRGALVLVVVALTWGYYSLFRFDGAYGDISVTLTYRWIPKAEDNYLAEVEAGRLGQVKPLAAGAVQPLVVQAGDWPGFRGPNRDGRLPGVKITTTWNQNPPRKVWEHLIGPGWSSFAVVGKHLFTQEQLGQEERVVCFDANTGDLLWVHKDNARFSETLGGDGPRATPTFHEGKLYALGATGILNCLDAATGTKIWSRDIVADSGATVPMWGFASSPLIVQDVVTVFAGGPDGKSVLGYSAGTGKPAWQAGDGKLSYSSPHLARLGGVEQVLVSTDDGLLSLQPASGRVLWNHSWQSGGIQRVIQPAILNDSDLLVGTPFGKGTRRVRAAKQGDQWDTQAQWTTHAINPYFNDLVVLDNHFYGFDGEFLTCVDLQTGKKKWRERGYDCGQLLLLSDQKMLLVLAEKGDVALVAATPEEFTEVARFHAIDGKTWNHPVVAHGKLFVRNSERVACFQLLN